MQYVNQVTNNFLSHFRNNQPPLVVCRHYKVILENCTETWKHTNIHSDIAPIIFPSDMNASNLKSIFKLMSPTEFKSKSCPMSDDRMVDGRPSADWLLECSQTGATWKIFPIWLLQLQEGRQMHLSWIRNMSHFTGIWKKRYCSHVGSLIYDILTGTLLLS